MVFPFGKVCSMIDSMMPEISRVTGIAGAAAVGVNNAVKLDFIENYWHQCCCPGILNHHRMDLGIALESTKNNNFISRSPASLAFARATRITPIKFNAAIKHFLAFARQMPIDDLPNFLMKRNGAVTLNSRQISRRTGSNSRNEKPQ